MIRFLLLLLLCLTRVFAAPPVDGQALDSPIAEGSKFTYEKLLGEICKDLEVDDKPASATGSGTIPIRELGESKKTVSLEGWIQVASVRTVPLPTGGPPRALVSFALSSEGEVWSRYLALFDLSGAPKLLDAVQVNGFPDDEGDYTKSLALGRAASAWIFDAFHSNSSQGYQTTTILYLHRDRIEMIEQQSLLSCTGCQSGSFKERLSVTTAPDPPSEFRKVVIQVRRTGAHPGIFTGIYRFDKAAGRFVTASRELGRLDEFNQKNY